MFFQRAGGRRGAGGIIPKPQEAPTAAFITARPLLTGHYWRKRSTFRPEPELLPVLTCHVIRAYLSVVLWRPGKRPPVCCCRESLWFVSGSFGDKRMQIYSLFLAAAINFRIIETEAALLLFTIIHYIHIIRWRRCRREPVDKKSSPEDGGRLRMNQFSR